MKSFYFITPFPDIIDKMVSVSILARAAKKNIVKYYTKNLYDFADPPNYKIDDYPFGGGSGMILKPEPIFRAYRQIIKNTTINSNPRVVFPTPDGKMLTNDVAIDLSLGEFVIFINGHYKGIDQRVRDELVTDEISIGDYVLTGGELPSLIILDVMIRLIPGVLNNYESAMSDSFYHSLLDCPHYTRPESYRGLQSPEVLLSGNHKKIKEWKISKREEKTKIKRPDLWKKYKK